MAAWLRGPLKLTAKAPYLSRVCLRNRFIVTDPGKAGNLALTIVYHGGAAVYLNGQGIPDLDARGRRVRDDSFLMCFNAHHEPIEFTLPPAELQRMSAKLTRLGLLQ